MRIRIALGREMAKDLKESVFALSFSTFGILLTAITLGVFTDALRDFPALLILIPPAIAMRGHIFSSLGSRLGTYLHTGELSVEEKSGTATENIYGSFTLSFSMSLYLGVVVWFIANHLGIGGGGHISFLSIILISYLAGFLSAIIMTAVTFTIAFASYRKGWNPDNVTAPLITLAGDVITLPLLFLSFHIVTGIGISVQTLIFLLFIGATILSFYPFRCGMPHFRRIVRESLPVFMLCGLLSTFSGTVLGSNSEALLSFAALILILPAFLEDGGAIGGILAARFSSALHTGEISPGAVPKKVLPLFLTMHIIGFIMFPLIGIFGFVIATFFSVSASIYEMVLISLIAGELLIFIVNFLAFYLSMFSFRMGINPDNVVIPVLTSTMDFVGTICLLGIAFMLHVV